VGLRPAAVVRLERALAHEVLLRHDIGGRASAGGRARAGCRQGRRRAGPVTPGSWSLRTAVRAGPSTDSDQHSRETGSPGARPDTDSSACTRRPSRGERRAGRGPLRRAGGTPSIVARLWMRLLASPSLRVAPPGFLHAGRTARPMPPQYHHFRAHNALTSDDVPPGVRSARTRRWPPRAVHSLWTLMWNPCVWSSTAAGAGAGPDRVGGADDGATRRG
jgi:hypothetical protein